MRKLGAAVVGLGIGRSHAEAYATLDEARLVAVCDVDPEVRRAVAAQYEAKAYASLDEVLADPEVEVVSIATPHPSHAPLAIQCARAGRHVLVEKPLALNVAAVDAMIEAANQHRVTLGGIFQRRFWPAALKARQAIAEGKIGVPVLGQCSLSWWRLPSYYERAPWRGRWDTEGGGVLTNQAIHAIDMFQWFMGEAVEVFGRWANLTHPSIEVEDNAAATIRFRSGALGVLTATTSSRWSHTRITVHGSNGASVGVIEEPEGAVGYNDVWTIPGETDVVRRSLQEHVERGEYIYRIQTVGDSPPYWPTDYQFQRPGVPSYHARQIQDFLRAVQSGDEPLVNGEEARKSVEILSAIYESARTGQPVSLPLR